MLFRDEDIRVRAIVIDAPNPTSAVQIPSVASASSIYSGAAFAITPSTGVSNGTVDNELAFGYNAGVALGRLDTTKPAISVTFEVDYNDGTHRWLEYHGDSVSSDNNGLRHFIYSRSLDVPGRADMEFAIGSDAASQFVINSFSTQLLSLGPTGLMNLTGALTISPNSNILGSVALELSLPTGITGQAIKVIGTMGGSSPIFYIGSAGGTGEGNLGLAAPNANANGCEIDLFSNSDVAQKHGTINLDNAGNLVFRQVTAAGQMFFDFQTQVNFRNAGGGFTTEATLSNTGNFVLTGNLTLGAAAPTVAAGKVGLGSTTATTVGAAGGASAPPATPLGYLIINVAGTQAKIPYYNN